MLPVILNKRREYHNNEYDNDGDADNRVQTLYSKTITTNGVTPTHADEQNH